MSRVAASLGSGAVVAAATLVVLPGDSLPVTAGVAAAVGLLVAVAVHRRPTVPDGLRLGAYAAGGVLLAGAVVAVATAPPTAADGATLGRAGAWLAAALYAVLGAAVVVVGRRLAGSLAGGA